MTQNLTAFWTHTKGSMRDLAPIVFVIGFFEFAVLQQVPDGLFGILVGVVLVVIGIVQPVLPPAVLALAGHVDSTRAPPPPGAVVALG